MNFNLNNFLSDLQKTLIWFSGNEDDVDHNNIDLLFDQFLNTIKNMVYLHAPLRQYSRNHRRLRQKP